MNNHHTNIHGAGILRTGWYGMLLCLSAAFLLAGCGDLGMTAATGGESGGGTIISGIGTGGTGVVKSSALTAAVDSGLTGAVAFVDANGNQLPDPGEPSAVTDQNGTCTLRFESVEMASCPVLVQAIAGKTVIKATGQVVSSSFVVRPEPH